MSDAHDDEEVYEGVSDTLDAIFERIKSASVVALEPPDPIVYDVEAILPADDAPGLMFGPPASLKSWLALALCDAIVRGEPFLGFKTRQRPSALYVNLDAGAKTFTNRVRSVSNAPRFDFVNLSASECGADVLRALVERYEGGFIVIDCFSSIYSPDTGRDPAHTMRAFVDDLRALFARFGCGGIIIDHPHRPKERAETGDYYGTVQKEAAFRTMWSNVAEPAEDGNARRRTRIVCRKISEGAMFAPIDVEVDFSSSHVSVRRAYVADPEARTSALQAKVLEWGRRQTVAFSKRNVTDTIRGHRTADVRDALDTLIDAGRIVATGAKRGNGELYRVAESESASASGTQRDAPDPLWSEGVPSSASVRPYLIGTHYSGRTPGTHSDRDPESDSEIDAYFAEGES